MKEIGNPNKDKEELNLVPENDPKMTYITPEEVYKVGVKYGLIGPGNTDSDLMWIAREALLRTNKIPTIDLYFVYLIKNQRLKKDHKIDELCEDLEEEQKYEAVKYFISENSWMKFTHYDHDINKGIKKQHYYFNFKTKERTSEPKETPNIGLNKAVIYKFLKI